MSAFFNIYIYFTSGSYRLLCHGNSSPSSPQHTQIKTVVTAHNFVQKSFALKVLQHWCLFA